MITFSSPTIEPVGSIPADIAKAIVLIKKDVKTIEHDAENKHGNYKYASVDAIYDGVRDAMAAHGLGLLLLETGFTSVGEKSIKFEYQWVLFTAESTWTHPQAKRTIVLPWNGPQTAQAAQSYVEKAVLKSLFKLKTGDAEPEGNDLGEAPKKSSEPKKKDKEPLDPTKSMEKAHAILDDLNKSYPGNMTSQDASDFAEKWGADLKEIGNAHTETIRNAVKAKRAAK